MRRTGPDPHASASAKSLRRVETEPEKQLWRKLRARQLGIKFRRQCPIGPYIADFLSLEAMLIVEIDGDTHASTRIHDKKRTAFLESQGFSVIRFSNHEVMTNVDGVLAHILTVAIPHPPTAARRGPPSPPRGEG